MFEGRSPTVREGFSTSAERFDEYLEPDRKGGLPHSHRRNAMKMKKLSLYFAALACAVASASVGRAQSVSVFMGGLKSPTKVVMTAKGNLIVTESGDGPNAGRLSVIDR